MISIRVFPLEWETICRWRLDLFPNMHDGGILDRLIICLELLSRMDRINGKGQWRVHLNPDDCVGGVRHHLIDTKDHLRVHHTPLNHVGNTEACTRVALILLGFVGEIRGGHRRRHQTAMRGMSTMRSHVTSSSKQV